MKWKQLKKDSSGIYRLEADDDPRLTSKTFGSSNFSQLAFDSDEERLVATDTRGFIYQFEFPGFGEVTYKKFEKFATTTCLAFNPSQRTDIILATVTSDVNICKFDLDNSIIVLARLSSHHYPVSHVTFYKHYCLTASSREAIIWDLTTWAKTHQLRFQSAGSNLRKTAFSKCGHIAALYSNDTMQIWSYEGFGEESRVSLEDYGMRGVKDFVFTRDGRAMVICAAKGGIKVLDTACFEPIASFDTDGIRSIPRRISIIPQTFDGGVARTLAILFADGVLQFLDLSSGSLVEVKRGLWRGIRNFAVSDRGRWIAWTEVNGSLCLCRVDGLLSTREDTMPKQNRSVRPRRKAHRAEDHLRSIKLVMKEELRLCRLLPMLKEFGEYPGKHRTVIWSAIMELPMNREACAGLAENVSQNASTRHMLSQYPLEDHSKASLLATTTDQLVRWCALLGQCQFLPALIFPFLTIFQKNRLLALEASITIITNFCQNWFEYHPLPPLNVLGMIENILLECDPPLLTCFCERGITSTDYAWPLLQTTLSEVLTGNDWLILWDHILSFRRPSFLLMCVVAYSVCCRETVIGLLKNSDDARQFYSAQGNLRVKKLLEVAQRIDRNTPERIHPDRYFRNDFIVLPVEGPYPLYLMHEYPKFIIEDQSGPMQLAALREEEKKLQAIRRKAMKTAEENRLRHEIENFTKEVHRNRMMELRKCHDEQLRIARFNVENTRDEVERYASTLGETTSRSIGLDRPMEKVVTTNNDKRDAQTARNMRNWSSHYHELRNEVQDLESEVQQFLSGSRARSSSAKVS